MQVFRQPKFASAAKVLATLLLPTLLGCDKAKPSMIDSAFFLCTTDPVISAKLQRSMLDANEYKISIGTASIIATVTSQLDRSDPISAQDLRELSQTAKLLWPKSLTPSSTGTVIYGLSGPVLVRFHQEHDGALVDRVGKSLVRCSGVHAMGSNNSFKPSPLRGLGRAS